MLFVFLALPAFGQLANVWHIPDQTRAGAYPSTMRDPLNPGASASTTFYQGNWKGGGGNQNGGLMYYRINGGSWQQVAIGFHYDERPGTGDHVQIWKASITMPSTPGAVVQYYFAPTFDNRTSPTYIYDSNGFSVTTATQATAEASPYSVTVGAAPLAMAVTSASAGTLNADYTTSKLFIDEQAAESVPVTIAFSTGALNTVEAEVWTNLNNRERADDDANGDSIDDGIISPPAPEEKPVGYVSGAYPANGYFQAIPMTGSNGSYTVTLNATKSGAYRLTARFRTAGSSTWQWYSSNGRRDHCITVTPKIARDMRVYEINVLNVDSTDATFAGRSTLESLTDNTRWNLDWLRDMGLNTLWFQPVHPVASEGREPSGGWDSGTGPYDPGSPYAVKNFFEINELMTVNYNGSNEMAQNRAASMSAFQNFVTTADSKGVHVMLDAPFNHTGYDCEIDEEGIALMSAAGVSTSGWAPGDKIKDRETRFYSRNDGGNAYSAPATSTANIAAAPDRNDFGKWRDVYDVFFGRYATLVTGYPEAQSSRDTVAIETDGINTGDLDGAAGTADAVTRAVWKYFARYVPYWLEKTGLPANSALALQTAKGIDGLRADFGQGMPPQFWEYTINVARAHKWNFVFMTESLDGGAVTYRSNRHFDILNENIVFPWQSASNTTGHRDIFENRRSSYGQGLVLLNNTSHDEAGYADPWEAFIRYAVGSTNDGAPMVMYGQEIGTANANSFTHYETNFGKNIPHFKRFNSMQPQWTAWVNDGFGVSHLRPAYSGVGKAREFSPALRSSNRWFLNPIGTTTADAEIFAVAKYESSGSSPVTSDVVLAFQNLSRNTTQANTFGIPDVLANNMGLKSGRRYNAKNTAAYLGPNNEYSGRRDSFLWGANGFTRENLITNGLYVSLNPVPATAAAWSTAPFEAQFLKVYDVTPLSAPASSPLVASYALDGSVTFSWSAVIDAEGLVPRYLLTVTRSNGQVTTHETTDTSLTITGIPSGVTATATVMTLNPNDVSIASSATSSSGQTLSITSAGDEDADGISNAAEVLAGTNPLIADAFAPQITSPASFNATVGLAFSTTLSATGDSPINYAATDLPAGLTLSDGVISGTPLAAGTFSNASLTASNTVGTASQSLTFTIAKGTPVITVAPSASAITVGQVLSDSTLSGGAASVPGTFAWSSQNVSPTSSGDYEVTFTPSAAANYHSVTTMVNVQVSPAGTTFSTWSEGAALNSANLIKYAIGGASGLMATDGVQPSSTISGLNLVLTAIVRTDDPKLTVVGEVVTNILDYGTAGSITTVQGVDAPDQTGVPAGCKRQSFTVQKGTDSKKFLRLKSTLAP
jgi:glycosidase